MDTDPQALTRTLEYFVRRRPDKPVDYEEAYWGTIVDPDGNVRDRSGEREKHLQDVTQELEFIRSLPPGRILDVGCGLGFLLSGLSGDWEKYGVEVSEYAADQAREWGEIFLGELHDAAYEDEYFDVVFMHHVIEHVGDPVDLIQEVWRVLRTGGYLVLGTPDFDSGCARRFGQNYRLLHDDTHISLFSNESMHRFLRDNGYVIDRVEYPFFSTRYFTEENLMRLFDTSQTSPPFYGNFMTFYCRKPPNASVYRSLRELSGVASRAAGYVNGSSFKVAELVSECLQASGRLLVDGDACTDELARRFVAELSRGFDKPTAQLLHDELEEASGASGDSLSAATRAKDVIIVLAASGEDSSALDAVKAAQKLKIRTIALVGDRADAAYDLCDIVVRWPTPNSRHIRFLHEEFLDAVCQRVREITE